MAAAARASGGAASLGRVEAASKLGMGATRGGHPVFMAGSGLGHKARKGRGRCGLPAVVVSGPVTRKEEDDAADMWGRAVNERREARTRARLRGLLGRDWAERGAKKRPSVEPGLAEWAARAEIRRGEKKIIKPLFYFLNTFSNPI